MSTKIDEALDTMTPQELAAFEVELDKKASEVKEAKLFALGRKMARESFAQYQKDGSLSHALLVAKNAADPGPEAQLDAALDKMSAEELAEFERAIDSGEITKSAEERASEEYAAHYFEIGRQMAREKFAAMQKGSAARIKAVTPPPAPGLGTKLKGIATEHPMATAGAAMGLGYLLGDRK